MFLQDTAEPEPAPRGTPADGLGVGKAMLEDGAD